MKNMYSLNKRVDILGEFIRPSNSYSAKVFALNAADRAIFDLWRRDCDAWSAQFNTPEGPYEAYLSGSEGPELDRRVSELLSGPSPRMTIDMRLDKISEIYQDFLQGLKR